MRSEEAAAAAEEEEEEEEEGGALVSCASRLSCVVRSNWLTVKNRTAHQCICA